MLLLSFFLSFLDAGTVFVLFCGYADSDDGFHIVLCGYVDACIDFDVLLWIYG